MAFTQGDTQIFFFISVFKIQTFTVWESQNHICNFIRFLKLQDIFKHVELE